jgi:hypothetical protein
MPVTLKHFDMAKNVPPKREMCHSSLRCARPVRDAEMSDFSTRHITFRSRIASVVQKYEMRCIAVLDWRITRSRITSLVPKCKMHCIFPSGLPHHGLTSAHLVPHLLFFCVNSDQMYSTLCISNSFSGVAHFAREALRSGASAHTNEWVVDRQTYAECALT